MEPPEVTRTSTAARESRLLSILRLNQAGKSETGPRHIQLSVPQQAVTYASNEVVTSKYTVLNFLPKNLWEQFHKASNIYFLIMTILQMVPSITTTNGVPTIALPLGFVLVVNAAKDAFEDWRRHRSDNEENQNVTLRVLLLGAVSKSRRPGPGGLRPSLVHEPQRSSYQDDEDEEAEEDQGEEALVELLTERSSTVGDRFDAAQVVERPGFERAESAAVRQEAEALVASSVLETVAWRDIRVGDLLLCRNRERFPSDILLLATSDPAGIAFVETSSLDGETNLKVKQPHAKTAEVLGHDVTRAVQTARSFAGSLNCAPPDANLSFFDGALTLDPGGPLSITPQQMLLRGCRLRNTEWVLGLVVYTGRETKIQMNATSTPRKVSRIEKTTNWLTLLIFGLQVIICIVGATATYRIATDERYKSMGYLGLTDTAAAVQGSSRFFTWLVLFVNMIPISLIVTMGLVKAAQGVLIGLDSDMYHSATQTFAVARTSDLNEELGQIQDVFTDKTGTLTSNTMEFRRCCIGGIGFGYGITEIRRNILRKTGEAIPLEPVPDPSEPHTPHVNFIDPVLRQKLRDFGDPDLPKIADFFVHLAVNQSVVPEKHVDGSVFYAASSPDEGALTWGACHFGVKFVSRSPSGLQLDIFGVTIHVSILATMEFTSGRKRSSALCHFPSSNPSFNDAALDALFASDRYVLYCKGADSVIMERLQNQPPSDTEAKTLETMESYALDGLRTLCIASRELQEGTVAEWCTAHEVASISIEKRQEKLEALADVENRVLNVVKKYGEIAANRRIFSPSLLVGSSRVAEEIEQQLVLQGVTGIEDKLQDGVGETLEALAGAGVKIWMLTGDKVETAVNIGVATNLLMADAPHLVYQMEALSPALPATTERGDDRITRASLLLARRFRTDLDVLRRRRGISASRSSSWPGRAQIASFGLPRRFKAFLYHALLGTELAEKSRNKRQNTEQTAGASSSSSSSKAGLVIDGDCLAEALRPELQELFLSLCGECLSVICCRVTPYQKGAVVSLVKKKQKHLTLAIGDGANDCSMIQCADVGVGLRGAEGMQAFNVSAGDGIWMANFLCCSSS